MKSGEILPEAFYSTRSAENANLLLANLVDAEKLGYAEFPPNPNLVKVLRMVVLFSSLLTDILYVLRFSMRISLVNNYKHGSQ